MHAEVLSKNKIWTSPAGVSELETIAGQGG